VYNADLLEGNYVKEPACGYGKRCWKVALAWGKWSGEESGWGIRIAGESEKNKQ